jgi:hypothetical protein
MTESSSPADEPLPDALAAFGVAVYCLVGVLSAVIEVLLIPLYIGSVIFPITVLIAVVLNVALPRLVRLLVDWRFAIALPLIGWVLTVLALNVFNTGHGTVLVPGYGQGQYVGVALFFGGALAGFVGVVRERGRAMAGSGRSPARR